MSDGERGGVSAQGNRLKIYESRFESPDSTKPASETVVRPEPDFDKVKHLCSDKPLYFNAPAKQ